jgi:hypothetical protein
MSSSSVAIIWLDVTLRRGSASHGRLSIT